MSNFWGGKYRCYGSARNPWTTISSGQRGVEEDNSNRITAQAVLVEACDLGGLDCLS